MTRLVVLGSVNADLTVVVPRHPEPGETLLASHSAQGLGGKGANQAAAAARSGARPEFVGAVGDDASGVDLRDRLGAAGVDVTALQTVTTAPSGVALITVSDDGENTIVVAAGANLAIDPDAALAVIGTLGTGDVLLTQLEVALDLVTDAARLATERGARVVLNLSPAAEVPEALLAACDPLVVNESEAGLVAGRRVDDLDAARDVAARLATRARSVVVTLGGDGVVAADTEGVRHQAAAKVDVVDTTGAGDAFAGALAARLAAGGTLDDAVADGVRAGGEAVQYVGAQPPA